MKSQGRAVIVFAFMALFTIYFGTRLHTGFTEHVPHAFEAIDTVIQIGLVSWLGGPNTLALLAFLTLLLPVLVLSRNAPEAASNPVRPSPLDQTSQPEIHPESRQFALDMLEGVVTHVVRIREMVKANERPKPFVRLVPQVPIQPGTPRSWFGGNPSLPEGTGWPTCDGKPAAFLAQIDCSCLPRKLWDGAGPRSGWLCFFIDFDDGRAIVKVLHTHSLGVPMQSPAEVHVPWLFSDNMGWLVARKDVPRWPVEVLTVSSLEQDPLIYANGDHSNNPRFVVFNTGFDLNEPRWKPFDRQSTLLLLEAAEDAVRRRLRWSRETIDRAMVNLQRLSEGPEDYNEPEASRQFSEERIAMATRELSAAERHLSQLETLRNQTATSEKSETFSEGQIDNVIAALGAIVVSGDNAVDSVKVFPAVCPPAALGHWLWNWTTSTFHYAVHLYAENSETLPHAWRTKIEEQAIYDAQREMGAMREFPDGHVNRFNVGKDVTLLQLPTSHLINWMWGDMYNLVLTVPKQDLARNDFSQVKVHISN